jgi:hypothetical protein
MPLIIIDCMHAMPTCHTCIGDLSQLDSINYLSMDAISRCLRAAEISADEGLAGGKHCASYVCDTVLY